MLACSGAGAGGASESDAGCVVTVGLVAGGADNDAGKAGSAGDGGSDVPAGRASMSAMTSTVLPRPICTPRRTHTRDEDSSHIVSCVLIFIMLIEIAMTAHT